MIGAIGSAVLLVVLMAQVFRDQFESVFHGNLTRFLQAVGVVFLANMSFVITERISSRLIKKQVRPSRALKYLSEAVQVYQLA